MQVLDSGSHVITRGCDVAVVVFDGAYHLSAMGTDAIINERIDQTLRNITKREELITTCGLDPDIARACVARVLAE